MRGALRTLFLTTAAVTAAVVLYLTFTLPPRAHHLDAHLPATIVTGAYHIHTNRSDGSGSVDAVAAAAAHAGLAFIILTDHGDGTRPPDPPAYRHGVLCIDAVEISTGSGHVVALGLASAAPFPLAGDARDVIADIHRFGGAAIAAHPDSPNEALRWRGPLTDVDGVEWLNLDSEWRDEPPGRLVVSMLRSLFRAPEVIVSLASRPVRTLQRWDAASRLHTTFGLAALDAHARIGLRETEEPRRGTVLKMPAYGAMFRTVAQSVVLDAPLSGNAASDAARVLRAVTGGHSFSIVRAIAAPAALDFSAEQGSLTASMGGQLPASDTPTIFRASVADAPGARVTLLRDGRPIASGAGTLQHEAPAASGVFRLEVTWPGQTLPWLMSNPITVGVTQPIAPAPAPVPAAARETLAPVPLDVTRWKIERDPASSAAVRSESGGLRFDFALAPGTPRSQYVALTTACDGTTGVGRVSFVGRAARPLRLSVQVRLPDGLRWRRSVYLDEHPRPVSINLDEFQPVDSRTSRRPVAAPVLSLLFVVDTLNTQPGAAGTVWIADLALAERSAAQ